MKILFVRKTYSFPVLYAGTEKATHALCSRLAGDGNQVRCASLGENKPEYQTDQYGYRTFRSEDVGNSVKHALEGFSPDVVVFMEIGDWVLDLPLDLNRQAVVCYQHNIHNDLKTLPDTFKQNFRFVANSEFTRHVLSLLKIRSAVVPPIFGIADYRGVEPFERKYAVFVCLQERKGFEIAYQLARYRPEREFLFVDSWGRSEEAVEKAHSLDNVRLIKNQPDLVGIFVRARVLLMPSLRTETWGLTASEAQVSKVPVLASNGGNLENTVGQGGVIVPLSLELGYWYRAFDLFYEDDFYDHICERATQRGKTLLQRIDNCYKKFAQVLHQSVEQHNRKRP